MELSNTPLTFCLRGCCSTEHYETISGNFVDGTLQGPVSITLDNGTQVTNILLKSGVINGISVTINTTSPTYKV